MSDKFKELETLDDRFSTEFDGRSRYFDKNGQPIKFSEWVRLFEDKEYQIVEQTKQGDIFVSTVWLGLNHNFTYGGDPPMIFETMIFGGKYDDGEYQRRYSTLGQAIKGHKEACAIAFAHSKEQK